MKRFGSIFQGEAMFPHDVVARVSRLMDELRVVEGGSKVNGSGRLPCWVPPSAGVVKLNTDAGVLDGQGVCLGMVARDAEGKVILCAADFLQVKWSVDVAEAKAILMAIQAAVTAGYRRVVIESDSSSVINLLVECPPGRSDLHLVAADIFSLSSCFDELTFCFVPRACNRVAHVLAHSRIGVVGRTVWFGSFPTCIDDSVAYDLAHINII